MKKISLSIFIAIFLTATAFGQNNKKMLTHDDIESWNRITEKIISANGKYIAYKTQPWIGDTKLFLYDKGGDQKASFKFGADVNFTYDSKYLVYSILPAADTVRALKLKKTKAEDMPGKKLAIYDIGSGETREIPELRSVKVPSKWSGWLAYQSDEPEKNKPINDEENPVEEESSDTVKVKKESSKNGYHLKVLNPETGEVIEWPFISSFRFAEEKSAILFVSTGDDDFEQGIYVYDFERKDLTLMYAGEGEYKQTVLSKDSRKAAFLFKSENEKEKNNYDLFLWSGNGNASRLNLENIKGMPENWVLSENRMLSFSEDYSHLYFGTAPVRPVKDTTILEDEYPNVDIWHGAEGKLHTVQVLDRGRDLRASYLAVYHVNDEEAIQLASKSVPEISLINKGNSDFVLGITNVPYELQRMWESSPAHYDVYLIETKSGKKSLIKKDIRAKISVSPDGNYIYWYNYPDSSWYAYNIDSGSEKRLTRPDMIAVANEIFDQPNYPGSYSYAGWLENDEAILLYDRYDIWKVDPDNNSDPVNMTIDGREKGIIYRYINFDREKLFIDVDEDLLLNGFNEETRESGYYSWNTKKATVPVRIIGGEYRLSSPLKARDAETVVYTVETFESFPDLLVSDLKFRKSVRISDANPQQSDFLWGTAELFSWSSLDGRELDGLLYKPENFDPNKKYPMIVNFYDKSSSGLYNYKTPELHRSTVDYHYYTSNGYIVFNPDVYYEIGYPGESAFNCVMPGVTALIAEGFIERDHIGAQGHSWGGYQVAYLATRTDIFAAIESGAPVVNMFSAYGGIRWWTGLNRSFQYEHTQSRIGATIWESPLRYIENSPLFTMDKVTTPILIMHNDQDGHVPWYQGIEYFIALRRLEKPVWMLNYTGEPHWPQKFKNKKDFQIRMAQFFDHYLNNKPMPRWMYEGIPVINKEFDLGYDLIKK